MKVRYGLMAFFIFGWGTVFLSAVVPDKIGDEKVAIPPNPLEITSYDSSWKLDDRNGDGKIDHAVQTAKNGVLTAEAYDFNFDGFMDDFYEYDGGVVITEMLDSNYDGKIDIWVHVYKGVYVAGYERDNDYDGKLDVVKTYGRDTLVKR